MCRRVLVIEASELDDESVVGDECHIVSAKGLGPRHQPDFPPEQLDEPSNLILLCRVHHKMVDDQSETYTAVVLRQLKENHEAWVSRCLSEEEKQQPIRIRKPPGQEAPHLVRLTSGRELMAIAGGSYQAAIDHAEPGSQEEADLMASFLQEVQDWSDLWNEIDSGERVKAGFGLSEQIRQLENAGFWVFGAAELLRVEGGVGPPSGWPVVHLRIVRSSDPSIISTANHNESDSTSENGT